MKLSDLKTDAEWDALLEGFASECGMTAVLTDATGAILREHGDRFRLCTAIREHDGALAFICSQTASAMLQELRSSLQPMIDLCEAGLVRVVVPVVRDGELVGQIGACGLASADEEFDPFLVAQTLEVDEEPVMELFRDTPTRPTAELERAAQRLFRELAEP